MKIFNFFMKETDYYDLPDFRNQWQQKIDEQIRAEEEEQRNRFNQKKKIMESLGEGVFEVFLQCFYKEFLRISLLKLVRRKPRK